MPISTVTIYRCADHQPVNGQYKIGSWAAYALETVSGVKNTGNANQIIQLPYSANILIANAVGIGGKIYDIVDMKRATFKEDIIELTVQVNAISSFITTSSVVNGFWEKTPRLLNLGVTVDMGADTLFESARVEFPKLAAISGITGQPYYYQIAATWDIFANAEDDLVQYGGFCPYIETILSFNSSTAIRYATSTGSRYYLTLPQLITAIDTKLGIPATSVLSVSISPRSPYRTADISGGISVLTGAGSTVTPVNAAADASIACIDITNSSAGVNPSNATERTLTLTEFQRLAGKVYIVDDKGNEIALIPNSWFDSSHQLKYYVLTYSDMNGIYTYVKIGSYIFQIPELQIPWIGDAWSEYKARSLAYDREAMERARDSADKQFMESAITSVGNSVVSAAVGGMAAGGAGAVAGAGTGAAGLVAAYRAKEQNKDNLKRNQIQKEDMIRKAASTVVNTQYGLDGCFIPYSALGAKFAGFRIDVPKNLTSDDLTNFVAYNGFPCGMYKSFTASLGYYKGLISSTPATANAPELEIMRNAFASGVRLV